MLKQRLFVAAIFVWVKEEASGGMLIPYQLNSSTVSWTKDAYEA